MEYEARVSYEMIFESGLLPMIMVVLYGTSCLADQPKGWFGHLRV